MSVTVVVPFRPESDERVRNWHWLRVWWECAFPEWPVIVIEDPAPERGWSKGRAVNCALEGIGPGVVIVADADCLPDDRAIRAAVSMTVVHGWVVPFGEVYRLSDTATARTVGPAGAALQLGAERPGVLDHASLDSHRKHYRGKPGGGVVVASTAALAEVGGYDPRFLGWGGEDLAVALALRVLVGPPGRLELPLWHLWHPPSPLMQPGGNLPAVNARLLSRYRRARRSRSSMAAVTREHAGG